MMTKETHLILDIKDIVRLRFQCKNPECKQEILYRLDRNDALKERCPFCNQAWIMPRFGEEKEDVRASLLRLLRNIIKEDRDAGVRPKLEVEIDDNLLKKQE